MAQPRHRRHWYAPQALPRTVNLMTRSRRQTRAWHQLVRKTKRLWARTALPDNLFSPPFLIPSRNSRSRRLDNARGQTHHPRPRRPQLRVRFHSRLGTLILFSHEQAALRLFFHSAAQTSSKSHPRTTMRISRASPRPTSCTISFRSLYRLGHRGREENADSRRTNFEKYRLCYRGNVNPGRTKQCGLILLDALIAITTAAQTQRKMAKQYRHHARVC